MSYKVGDKVVYEVKSVIRDNVYLLSGWKESEPLERKNENKQKQIERLVDKLHRQAAEITRLLAENEKLKAENGNVIWEIEQAFDRGCNEAWELARKCMLMSSIDREVIFGSGCNAMYGVLMYHTYPEAAAKVEAWEKAKEKPQKTILMDLLEKHPNIETKVDGLPKFCPFILGYKVLCSSKKTCKECWNRPLEQIGEE